MLRHSTLDDIEYSKPRAYSAYSRSSSNLRRKKGGKALRKARRKSEHFNRNFSVDQCAVCLEDDATQKLDTKLFPCGHVFHGQCLIEWVNSIQNSDNNHNAAAAHKQFNCPLCRQHIAHFVQLTSDQHINEKLVQIWNEMYLFGKKPIASAETAAAVKSCSGADKRVAVKLDQSLTDCCKSSCIATVTDDTAAAASASVAPPLPSQSPTLSSLETDAELSSSLTLTDHSDVVSPVVGSVWKLLWTLSPVPKSCKDECNIIALLAANSNACNLWSVDAPALVTRLTTDMVNEAVAPTPQQQHLNWHRTSQRLQSFGTGPRDSTSAREAAASDVTQPRARQSALLMDEIRWNLINFESGVAAGVFSALSTHAMTHQLRYELTHYHRGLAALRLSPLLPVLSETVPSVTMFFVCYESIKQHLFDIDNVNHSASLTFGQRFCSAAMASSVSYCVGAKGNFLANRHFLPLRFATFFGTFEGSKDWLNRDHTQLGVAKVAASAAVGGTVAHVLYYPVLSYQNHFVASIANVPLWVNGKALYRGWLQSFRKFLPSTVLCSISFEYTKRYLNGNM